MLIDKFRTTLAEKERELAALKKSGGTVGKEYNANLLRFLKLKNEDKIGAMTQFDMMKKLSFDVVKFYTGFEKRQQVVGNKLGAIAQSILYLQREILLMKQVLRNKRSWSSGDFIKVMRDAGFETLENDEIITPTSIYLSEKNNANINLSPTGELVVEET